MIIVLTVIYIHYYKSINWNGNLKSPLLFAMLLSGVFIFPIVGGIIRSSGRKYYFEYFDNPGALEINRLQNGQLVVMNYKKTDHSLSNYFSALNMDDTEISRDHWDDIPTYVDYMYIIDSVKSCTRTKNGLMVESSGRYYGERAGYYEHDEKAPITAQVTCYRVFAEAQVLYRKEEILDIFANMDQLEAELMNYKDYQVGRDAFVPYGNI